MTTFRSNVHRTGQPQRTGRHRIPRAGGPPVYPGSPIEEVLPAAPQERVTEPELLEETPEEIREEEVTQVEPVGRVMSGDTSEVLEAIENLEAEEPAPACETAASEAPGEPFEESPSSTPSGIGEPAKKGSKKRKSVRPSK